jgi:hypothetical protein
LAAVSGDQAQTADASQPAAIRRSTKSAVVGVLLTLVVVSAVGGALAWRYRRSLALAWRLHTLVDRARIHRSMDLKQPEIAYLAVDGVFLTDGEFAGGFRGDSVSDVLALLETDPSADRRFGAAVLLGRIFGSEARREDELALRLARCATADPHPAVRHGLQRLIRRAKWSDDQLRQMIRTIARAPLERRADVLFAISGDDDELRRRIDLVRGLLAEVAENAEPLQAIRAASLLERSGRMPDNLSLPSEAFETLSFNMLRPAQRVDLAVAMVRFAPEFAQENLKTGGEGHAELLAAVALSNAATLERLGVDLVFDSALLALSNDDRWGVGSLQRLLAARPNEIDRVAAFLERQPDADRATMCRRLLEFSGGADRRVAKLDATTRARLAKLVWTTTPTVANAVAGLWENWEKNRPPPTAEERARYRARLRTMTYSNFLTTPMLWQRLFQAVTAPPHSAADVEAVEAVVDALVSTPADTVGDSGYSDRDLFIWYRDHGDPQRVAERFVRLERECASQEAVGAMVAAATTDERLLDRIADGVLRRTDVANHPRAVFARASHRIVQSGRKRLDRETAARVWAYWIRTLPAAPDEQAKLPSLAEARKLVPADVARAGVEAYFAEAFRPPDPLPPDDWLEGIPNFLQLSLHDALATMPEYQPLLARWIADDLASPNAWRRFRAYRVATRFAKGADLETATVERLLEDSNTRVSREALLWVDAETVKRLSPAGREKIRKLCKESTDPGVLAGAVYAIVELPDRNDDDYAVVSSYRSRTETLVQWAVRYALKNWNRGR